MPDATSSSDGQGHTIISNDILDSIFAFAGQTHSTVLWNFNGLSFRKGSVSGPWDPTGNATAMLSYLNSKYSGAIKWAWSLGNEPDLWPGGVANMTQLALDALALQTLLKSYNIGTEVYGPALAGPDVAHVTEFLTASRGGLTGLTVHNYPLARNCTVDAYLNSKQAVTKMGESLAAVAVVAKKLAPRTQLVLEENAGSYGGGCENITDRFVGGFYWLAALGETAASGFGRIHRQDIAGWSFTGGQSHYQVRSRSSLCDVVLSQVVAYYSALVINLSLLSHVQPRPHNRAPVQLVGPAGWTNGSLALRPHPDWYTSVLFKQLVGNGQIMGSVTGDTGEVAATTIHAWCQGAPWWYSFSLVLTFVNPTGADVNVTVAGGGAATSGQRTEYFLTSDAQTYHAWEKRMAAGILVTAPVAPPESLTADEIYMNGVLQTVDASGVQPHQPMPGRVVKDGSTPLILPPYSYGFVAYSGDTPKGC